MAIFISCHDEKIVKNSSNKVAVDSVLPVKEVVSAEPNEIDFYKEIVIDNIYVIDRKGLELKQQPNENSKTLGLYEYGAGVEVIEDAGDWLGVRERIQRNYEKADGTKVESSGWEKVYVKKSGTGKLSEIFLIPEDLNMVNAVSLNGETKTYDKEKALTGYLSFELIDKKLFDAKQITAVNFLLVDTASFKKKKGILELPSQKKKIKFIDKPGDGDYRESFEYEGQVEFLNKYLISGSYYEGMDYKFMDKTSGEETQSFNEYPHISVDRKNIICIYANPYESTSDLQLYSINNQQTKLLMSASFTKWVTTQDLKDIFYGADGYLYLVVIHFKAFWGETPDSKAQNQYMRIGVL